MSDEVAIKVENVGKSFKLPYEKNSSVKSAFLNFYKRRGYETQKALDGVSFQIKKGEFFGIVGRNGSGKSTLLKLLAEIYMPTSGNIHLNGKLTPFIELGVGFNPELTGRENVFLNGALMGFNRKEMQAMYASIVEFAELGKFMDQKLKNYSSGMQVRLAFSIAIRAQSDILLIDEVLAVGDLDFQKKCYSYFFNLKKQGRTIVFVTHDMSAIRRFCTRAIIINDGKIISEGRPDDIARMYETLNLRSAEQRLEIDNKRVVKKKRQGNALAVIVSSETYNPQTGKSQNTFSAQENIGVRINFKAKKAIPPPAVGFIFQNQEDLTVFATNNQLENASTKALKIGDTLTMETVVDNIFTDGEYTITAAIESDDFEIIYDRIEYLRKFMIAGHKLPHALAHPDHKISILTQKSKAAKR